MRMLDDYSKKLSAGFNPDADEVEIQTRIATVESQLESLQRQLAETEGHVETHVLELGHKTLEQLRSGKLVQAELAALLPPIEELEQRISALRDEIADKEEALGELRRELQALNAELPPAPAPESDTAPTPHTDEPLGLRTCPECSTELYEGVTYCTSCGAKLE